jgi:L-amino acid N-acyltransferase YncA
MLVIEPMTAADWPAVRSIYEEGIATGNATFETQAPAWTEWDSRHVPECRLVVRDGDRVVAWAALSRASARQVYAGVAEDSIYVASLARGQGIANLLLSNLVRESERQGVWTLQTSIFPENEASLRLHRACGFREVGRRERIARLHSIWRDTILMERRSSVIGT